MTNNSREENAIRRAGVSVRCLVVGPEACGKTGLVSALIRQFRKVLGHIHFISSAMSCVPGAMQYQCESSCNSLIMVDIPGDIQRMLVRLKHLRNLNIICYCYAVDGHFNLAELSYWVKELAANYPGMPSILVACKNDLREKRGGMDEEIPLLIPREKGADFKKKYKIDMFYEFSEKLSEDGINKILAGVFELASGKSVSEDSHSAPEACCFLL